MRRIHPDRPEVLRTARSTREIEQRALLGCGPHTLMARAGDAVARLASAISPHAREVWVACGPGNNGGDGLVAAAAMLGQARATGSGLNVVATLCAPADRLPADARWALAQAQAMGLPIIDEAPAHPDLVIDALLGLGPLRPAEGRIADHLMRLQAVIAPVLCVDLPSGLDPDTGRHLLGSRRSASSAPRHTLSLLTLKPGLFTADGRDQAGTVWFDDLGVHSDAPPDALLHAHPQGGTVARGPHASHKGLRGDVVVLGGQDVQFNGQGMTGAAVLAARAALHAGAGRVYVGLLGAGTSGGGVTWDPIYPELMFREGMSLAQDALLTHSAVVCGCGGGDAVAAVLPHVLQQASQLVLDADGLNAIAVDRGLQRALRQRAESPGHTTVITPHPLEAARLLSCTTADVMANRLAAARELSDRFGAICVLKGSGTVTCAPRSVPRINASGNAALATAGTGDVLAGMIGAALAASTEGDNGAALVADAVHRHGWLADRWIATADTHRQPLTASTLARL